MKEQESILMTLDYKENWEREKESRRDGTHATKGSIHTDFIGTPVDLKDATRAPHACLNMELLNFFLI